MQVLRHFPAAAESPTAVAIGNFDGVHLGHQSILRRLGDIARSAGLVSCLLTFEPHPREFFTPDKAPTRLTSLREKLELFEEAGIDRVHVCHFDARFAATGAETFMRDILQCSLAARVVLVGDDFRFGAGRSGTLEALQTTGRTSGFEVEVVTPVALDGMRVSSTAIRQALAAGDLVRAAKLLGRDYSMSGHVVHGDKLGRELGYPTANVEMHHDRPPLNGIYAVKLSGLGGAVLPGVASLGVRPTLKQKGVPTLEVHLFDFSRDIYGQHVRVHFLKKLREEEKFSDIEALRRQIALDERAARDFFVNEPK